MAEVKIAYYFVDEAGDTTLFHRRGRAIVGTEGVSKVFMVGVANLPDPEKVSHSLEELRRDLLADPYFKGVPSMQPQARETALFFHAKNDLPEVRREVFKLLSSFNATVQVAIRRKAHMAAMAKLWQKFGGKYRMDDVYDDLVRRVFQSLLHQSEENHICFARRGKSSREKALRLALAKARTGLDINQLELLPKDDQPLVGEKANRDFEAKHGFPPDYSKVISAYPHQSAGLQVVDYYLWALQRLYERGEDRFFALLYKDYKLVMDLDDERRMANGESYSEANPLILEKIMPVAG